MFNIFIGGLSLMAFAVGWPADSEFPLWFQHAADAILFANGVIFLIAGAAGK